MNSEPGQNERDGTKPSSRPWLLALAVVATIVIPAAVLFISITGSQSTSTDPIAALLPNPGFQDGLTGWVAGYAGRDQDQPNDGYEVDIDRSVTYSSTASARISSVVTGTKQATAYGYISTRIPADYFRGKRVRLSAYLRTAWQPRVQPALAASLYMEVPGTIDGRPTDPSIPMSSDGLLPGQIYSGPWLQRTVVLDVPRAGDFLLLGMRVAGIGNAWIDEVKLEIVSSDVPTTDKAGKKTLDNLDFEQGLTSWLKGVGTEISLDIPNPTHIGTNHAAAHSGQLGAYIRYVPNATVGLHYPMMYGQTYRDKRVRISAYLNVDNAPQGATLYVDTAYLDPTSKKYPLKEVTAQAMPGKSGQAGWQQVEATLDIPDRTWGILFGFKLDGEGEVWIDDVKVEVLGAAP